MLKDKTPDFDKGYEKIKHDWPAFVAYKKSEDALQKSKTNKANASKKTYHHTMGPAGYEGCMPKWEAIEAQYLEKGITPEPLIGWTERTRLWFYAHGGKLDKAGKAMYNKRHKDNPLLEKKEPSLPIEEIRKAVKDVEEGRFVPDREKDELTRALGNEEHKGRTRGTPGSKPWTVAFPPERKKYPDRSHLRRKEREAAEATQKEREAAQAQARIREVEDRLRRLEEVVVSQQSGQADRRLIEAAFDGNAGPSARKSSVASTELQGAGDDALTMSPPSRRYPVDDITESTSCELKLKVANLRLTAAAGMVVPGGPKPTYHCKPVPQGYAVVTVDEVMTGYEELKLDYPGGEDGELTQLGELRNGIVLWPKENIVLLNWQPRPPTPQSSRPYSPPPHQSPQQSSPPPRQPSPAAPHSDSPSPHQSPEQSSPPPRQRSPSPEAQSQTRTEAKGSKSFGKKRFRSPKRKLSPLPTVPHKNMKKRPYDYTDEETAAHVAAKNAEWLASLKNKKPEPQFPATPAEHAACVNLVHSLSDPKSAAEEPDYNRCIVKQAEAKQRRLAKSGKSVAQLGEQKKQSVAPLRVPSDAEVQSRALSSTSAAEERYDPETDPEFVAQYGEAAAAQGMTIVQYMSHIEEFGQETYKFENGRSLVRPEYFDSLPTKMRKVHKWYMQQAAEGYTFMYLRYQKMHYGHDTGNLPIEFSELFQLYQQDALDKSILSAYCL